MSIIESCSRAGSLLMEILHKTGDQNDQPVSVQKIASGDHNPLA